MATIMELRTKRAQLWEGAKAFLDSHTDKDGKLSAEDAAAYDKMEADVVALGKDIERMERQMAIDAELAKPTSEPIVNKPAAKMPEKTGRAADEYRKAMLAAIRSNFRNVSNVLQEGVDTDGGYLVPEEYDSRLIDVLNEECIMRNLGTKITTSGERKINIAATKPAASWIEEGGALSFGDATFDQIIMDAYKLHVAIKVTEELLYDAAFNLESYIIQQFGKAIANAEEDAFLNGDGNHKPTGLLTTAQTGVTTSGASITADDLIELVYKLKRPYRKSASFIVNDQTLAAIRKLKDANQAYMWQPSYQMGEPDRLLGYPIHTTPFMPTAEAGKAALVFGDYSYYNIGDRGARSIQELRELFAGNGMIAFVMKERVDGKLILPEAVQMLKIKGTAGKG
ncbi:phage major capsid protein [Selenomonas ruminantium]|uniref:Phage major capsid protein, HK97 family n=1 Tax=Selenomonas ruminantium TaxID=971 RepID=A0A1K1M4L3_SELRU|nr:phage major capsid protein [Selenomonas ruminantium]SFW18025.1 phage major capsid protein, HK97 family [Selenomonas ruminantium]